MNSPTQPMVARSIRMVAVHVMPKNAVPLSAASPMSPPNSLTASVARKMTTVAIAEARPRQRKPSCELVNREETGHIESTHRVDAKICQCNLMLVSKKSKDCPNHAYARCGNANEVKEEHRS